MRKALLRPIGTDEPIQEQLIIIADLLYRFVSWREHTNRTMVVLADCQLRSIAGDVRPASAGFSVQPGG